MIINVLSRMVFNNLMQQHNINDNTVENYNEVFFISINDTKSSPYYEESWFKKDHDNVKVLYFDDVENENETSPTNSGKCVPFSSEMAKDLYEFIKRNVGKEQVIIHCLAGIARSAGAASVVADMNGVSFAELKRTNPQICPNQRVTRLLNRCRRADTSLNVE